MTPRLQPSPSAIESERSIALRAKAIELVKLSLEMTSAAGSGHPTSAASLAHLVAVLMYDQMRWDPSAPDDPGSDRLLLSEGHACPIVYAACADLGVAIGDPPRAMTRADLRDLRTVGSPVAGHPNPAEGFPFFPAATGSLGQGLSIAAGLAFAARLDGIDKRVYCLIGDGESREGQVWEALDFLVDHELFGVCPIFNANGKGQTGPVSRQQSSESLAHKLEGFGFEALTIDGHDPGPIAMALARHAQRAREGAGRPVAVVAETVKGWGMPSFGDTPNGHHGTAAKEGEQLERALAELDEEREKLGAVEAGSLPGPQPIPEPPARIEEEREPTRPRDFASALRAAGEEKVLQGGALAPRKAYGLALEALGAARRDVVVLDADVSNSTYAQTFVRDGHHAERFIECRIAEQNMISCAAGLAVAGKRPFASSFGRFLERGIDQLEMALVGGARLVLCGSHVGLGPAADGPSQMALSDASWFAALAGVRRGGRPLLHVLTPADAACAYELTLHAADHDGSVYLRTMRPDVPLIEPGREDFRIGGHRVLREGTDLLIVAWGYEVHDALRAGAELEVRGISATVLDLYSIPFDEQELARLARESGRRVLVVEDDYGALSRAVAESLARTGEALQLESLRVRAVPPSGRTPDDVMRVLGLSCSDIVEHAGALATGGLARSD